MTWHCPCGRRNRDNVDVCSKCGGPQNIPSWAKPKVKAALPVRSGLLTVLIAGAAAFGFIHQSNAQVNYQTPSGDTVIPSTASLDPTLSLVDPGTGEGDTKPWTQYTGSPSTSSELNEPADEPSSQPSSTPSSEETQMTTEPTDEPIAGGPEASVDSNGIAHSAPKPTRPTPPPPTEITMPPADGGYYDNPGDPGESGKVADQETPDGE